MATSIEELKNINNYKEIELPPFMDGTKITVKVKNVSLITMLCNGRISNPLIKTVLSMIDHLGDEKENTVSDEQTETEDKLNSLKFIFTVAQECLVSPSYKELQENNINLTDSQIMYIFSHAMSEVKDLEKFC